MKPHDQPKDVGLTTPFSASLVCDMVRVLLDTNQYGDCMSTMSFTVTFNLFPQKHSS
jgi:hypothetical protein